MNFRKTRCATRIEYLKCHSMLIHKLACFFLWKSMFNDRHFQRLILSNFGEKILSRKNIDFFSTM